MTQEAQPFSRSSLLTMCRYVSSGGASTALHWITMAWLIFYGISPLVSTGLGALAGAALNYFLQFYFTFPSSNKHQTTVPRYVLITLLSWLSNSGLFFLLFKATALPVSLVQLVTTALVTLLNFFLYQRLVFHASNPSRSAR